MAQSSIRRDASHGIERLSVVDASIMPKRALAFTHIPTVMIAERLSEQIAAVLQPFASAALDSGPMTAQGDSPRHWSALRFARGLRES